MNEIDQEQGREENNMEQACICGGIDGTLTAGALLGSKACAVYMKEKSNIEHDQLLESDWKNGGMV